MSSQTQSDKKRDSKNQTNTKSEEHKTVTFMSKKSSEKVYMQILSVKVKSVANGRKDNSYINFTRQR